MRENGSPQDFLKRQPGQVNPYQKKFHPLPGPWAQEQLESPRKAPVQVHHHRRSTPLQHALREEQERINQSLREQGITPGQAIYENPRANQNTLLPTEKFANG